MMKYQCDVRLASSVRCPRQAAMAFDKDRGHGREMFLFCLEHAPTDWSDFQAAYRIENKESARPYNSANLSAPGISRRNRELQQFPTEGGTITMQPLAKEAIERYNEKKYDALFMRELRIRWP